MFAIFVYTKLSTCPSICDSQHLAHALPAPAECTNAWLFFAAHLNILVLNDTKIKNTYNLFFAKESTVKM